jgi:hypothetical protein
VLQWLKRKYNNYSFLLQLGLNKPFDKISVEKNKQKCYILFSKFLRRTHEMKCFGSPLHVILLLF